jgi:CheY-like chemotaxis protein
MLAIEPDRLLLRTIRRHLSAYEVMEVKDNQDLPALIDFYQPVAVLVDVSDSSPDGPAQWAARLPPDLPLILVAMPGSLNSARALGIHNYLIKPIARDQLLEAIASVGHPVRTILIVDDDPRLMGLLSRMLQSSVENYQLLRAFGGQQALALLRQHPVDLVLLDLVMPDLSGLEVLKARQAAPALARIPVIVISAQAAEESGPQVGLFLQVTRQQGASLSEILACLKGLMEGLPRREAPALAGAAALRAVPDGPPVS